MNEQNFISADDIKPENFPTELKVRRQWVNYKLEKRGVKTTKIPVDPKTGRNASVTDPNSWADFTTAMEGASQYSGVGFVLTEGDNLVMIDLDGCLDPETEQLNEFAAEMVERFSSYTEISPSRTGVHIFVRGTIPGPRNRTDGIEFYSIGRSP